MPHAPFGDNALAAILIDIKELPIAVGKIFVLLKFIRPDQPPRRKRAAVFLDPHQVRTIGVLLDIIKEIWCFLFVMELIQDDMGHRHPERPVAAGMQRHPLVGVFADLAEVWRKNNRFRPVVAGFGKIMAVGCARHIQTRSHIRDHFRVVPIRAFTDIRLLSPNFREGVREVTIPIVKT